MKKLKNILSILLILVLMVPMMVRAEDEEDIAPEVIATNNEPVNVYIFRSDTCGYCKALMEWITSDEVQETYGNYFKVVDYEVSTNADNAKLMQKVKDYFKATGNGVPYMVVGEYDYPEGFASDAQIDEDGNTMGDQLLARIIETYMKEDRFDVFKELGIDPNKKKDDNNVAVGIIAGVVILTIAGVVIVARKNN